MKHTTRNFNDPNQSEFVGIIWQPLGRQFRLAAGDVFQMDNRLCRVLRVNECAAVILMNRPERCFNTRFRGQVRFQPTPATFRISPNAEIPVLNRKTK